MQASGQIANEDLTAGMLRVQESFGTPIARLLADDYRRMSTREMAERYGVSHQAVLGWMDRLGIERRLRGQRPPAD
jgi:transcriptional regulator of aromatic amino acid metabolism